MFRRRRDPKPTEANYRKGDETLMRTRDPETDRGHDVCPSQASAPRQELGAHPEAVESHLGAKEHLEELEALRAENESLRKLLPAPGSKGVISDALAGRTERIYQERRAKWSHRTFGTPEDTGAIEPILHLLEEVRGLVLAAKTGDMAAVREELADCRMLLDDAVERAGVTREEHHADYIAKQLVCENRTWAKSENGGFRHVKAEAVPSV